MFFQCLIGLIIGILPQQKTFYNTKISCFKLSLLILSRLLGGTSLADLLLEPSNDDMDATEIKHEIGMDFFLQFLKKATLEQMINTISLIDVKIRKQFWERLLIVIQNIFSIVNPVPTHNVSSCYIIDYIPFFTPMRANRLQVCYIFTTLCSSETLFFHSTSVFKCFKHLHNGIAEPLF